MKIAAALAAAASVSGVSAFAPAASLHRSSTAIFIGREEGVDLSGNAWKPDSEKMGVSSSRWFALCA